jgi:hypothetical protein
MKVSSLDKEIGEGEGEELAGSNTEDKIQFWK